MLNSDTNGFIVMLKIIPPSLIIFLLITGRNSKRFQDKRNFFSKTIFFGSSKRDRSQFNRFFTRKRNL